MVFYRAGVVLLGSIKGGFYMRLSDVIFISLLIINPVWLAWYMLFWVVFYSVKRCSSSD